MLKADPGILAANLRLIQVRSARAAEAIRNAASRPDAVLTLAEDGGLTGTVIEAGQVRQLASRRGPIAEGEKLAATVDVKASAAIVVMGFGAGHHIEALMRRLGFNGAVIVFEPDVALLRAVLERVDMSRWLAAGNFLLMTDPDDTGAIASGTQGFEAVLASGTKLLDHPPSKARLGDTRDRFAAAFAHVMKAVRTNVVTTLVQVDVTVRNLLQNLRWYSTARGVDDLAGAEAGRPAIVVAAGPSLRRNVELLAQPGVRDRVVIIAVQTVLKQLLAMGIRPHFVTALDYHEISRRFYEGLTAKDVEGVTLVVEPKANPAILEAWPGELRCVGDDTLDAVLGDGLAREMGRIQPGATVAHLAYYLARHLDCDPVILIGQDLGFTDGQYYGPNAAIHNVWAGELNEFNTLEMLEWQRIARMRNMLRKTTDQFGREIYTDEQMSTYLVQFERDFMRDKEKGLTTIDATEGGVRKQHTTVMPLAQALQTHTGDGARIIDRERRTIRVPGAREVEARVQELRRAAWRVGELSRRAADVLSDMQASRGDQALMNRLIARVGEIAKEAANSPVYWLVQHINQAGQLNRYRADRAIAIDGVTGLERQKREIERDLKNVQWLGEAAGVVGEMLDDALVAYRGGRVQTREGTPMVKTSGARRRVWACIAADHEVGGLGVPRDLSEPFLLGMNPVALLLARLAQCKRLDGVVLLCRDVDRMKAIAGRTPAGLRVEFEAWRPDERERRAKAVARLWARHCWRGGLANLTCFDEALDAKAILAAMTARGADAAVVLNADWALTDPALVDALIERHEERPDANALTFTQAAPGLAPCLVARQLIDEMARVGGSGATVGTLLGYSPVAPQSDPIAKSVCVDVPPAVRDAMVRCIPDTPAHAARLSRALRSLGELALEADAALIVRALHDAGLHRAGPPESITLHVTHGANRGATGLWLREVLEAGDAPTVTFIGDGCDALDVPGLGELAATARAFGASAVHVQTSLGTPGQEARRGATLADVISVELFADEEEAYRQLSGREGLSSLRERVAALVGGAIRPTDSDTHAGPSPDASIAAHAWPSQWIVPRITRRDEVYAQIESFYTRWLVGCGACVIDPLATPPPGARIEALPLPAAARERLEWSRVVIGSDGVVHDLSGTEVADLRSTPIRAREAIPA